MSAIYDQIVKHVNGLTPEETKKQLVTVLCDTFSEVGHDDLDELKEYIAKDATRNEQRLKEKEDESEEDEESSDDM